MSALLDVTPYHITLAERMWDTTDGMGDRYEDRIRSTLAFCAILTRDWEFGNLATNEALWQRLTPLPIGVLCAYMIRVLREDRYAGFRPEADAAIMVWTKRYDALFV